MRLFVVLAAVLLSGCATVEYRDREVIRTVPTPYLVRCISADQIPARPTRIAEDVPVRPTDPDERERILGAKVAEWQGYGEVADAALRACASGSE